MSVAPITLAILVLSPLCSWGQIVAPSGKGVASEMTNALFSLSVTNGSLVRVLEIRMPTNDAIRVLESLYWAYDQPCRDEILTNGILRISRSTRLEVLASLNKKKPHTVGEETNSKGFIDHQFVDRRGNCRLFIHLPKRVALEPLKTAMGVGDFQFRFQLMKFGLLKCVDTSNQQDILTFLAEIFDAQETIVQGDILFAMANIDVSSKQTIDVIKKAVVIKGNDREHTFVRKLAEDIDSYIKTGDQTILKQYQLQLR